MSRAAARTTLAIVMPRTRYAASQHISSGTASRELGSTTMRFPPATRARCSRCTGITLGADDRAGSMLRTCVGELSSRTCSVHFRVV